MNRVEAMEFAKEQQEIFGGRMGEFLKFVFHELSQTNASNTLNALDSVDLISRKAAIEEVLKGKVDEDESLVECPAECNAMIDGAVEDIKALPSAPRWIPVTEQLPKLDEDVLLCYIEYDHWHGQYVSVGQGKRFTFEWVEDGEDENEVEWEWVFANELVHLVEVKYWMPLPEPPKGE